MGPLSTNVAWLIGSLQETTPRFLFCASSMTLIKEQEDFFPLSRRYILGPGRSAELTPRFRGRREIPPFQTGEKNTAQDLKVNTEQPPAADPAFVLGRQQVDLYKYSILFFSFGKGKFKIIPRRSCHASDPSAFCQTGQGSALRHCRIGGNFSKGIHPLLSHAASLACPFPSPAPFILSRGGDEK